MSPASAARERPTYTALIRWRGPDHAVEIETQHPGFATSRAAALFAASGSQASPHSLRLSANRIELLLGDGRYVNFPYDAMTAWIMSTFRVGMGASTSKIASQFQMHSHSTLATYCSAHGDYRRAWYIVLGPDGTPVHVQIGVAAATSRMLVIGRGLTNDMTSARRRLVKDIEDSTGGRLRLAGHHYKLIAVEDLGKVRGRGFYEVVRRSDARGILSALANHAHDDLALLLAQARERLTVGWRPPYMEPDGLILLRLKLSPRMVRVMRAPASTSSHRPKLCWR
jgi:hypothetical protein